MSEDRFTGDLQDQRASSFQVGLLVAGGAVGLFLLLCVGVAAYVAWSGPPPEAVATVSGVEGRLTNPDTVWKTSRKIVEIDLPAGFEPIFADEFPPGPLAVFGRKSGDGALLKLRRVYESMIPPGSDPEGIHSKIMKTTENGDDLTGTVFATMEDESTTTREVTVLGIPAQFRISRGKRSAKGKILRKVGGNFAIGNDRGALVFTIPEEEFDEEAVVRMIESIRQTEGEVEPWSFAPPSTKSPKNEASKTDSSAAGKKGRDDDAPSESSDTPRSDDDRPESG